MECELKLSAVEDSVHVGVFLPEGEKLMFSLILREEDFKKDSMLMVAYKPIVEPLRREFEKCRKKKKVAVKKKKVAVRKR